LRLKALPKASLTESERKNAEQNSMPTARNSNNKLKQQTSATAPLQMRRSKHQPIDTTKAVLKEEPFATPRKLYHF
jgi:hypothetical protein